MRELTNILWVPDLARNMLFVVAIIDCDLQVRFDKEVVITNNKNEIVARGVRRNNVYELLASTAQANEGTSRLWHERFGHLSMQTLPAMQKSDIVADLPPISDSDDVCEACMKGKQHRQPFPQESRTRAEAPLQLVHADLCGKMNTQALGGSSYYFA